jgi:AcrR family transcriptional regulator
MTNWRARVVDRSVERAAASPGDRRTPESIARRALRPTTGMVKAAMELAEERGGASFTVQDVLLRAGVSLQTFYRHFPGKDELILAVIEESVCAQTASYRREIAGIEDPVARVEFIVKAPFLGGKRRSLSPMIVREHLRLMEDHAREVRAADDSYREVLREAIEAAQAAHRFAGVDAAEESEMIMALVLTRYHNFVLGVVARSATKEAEHVWRFCLAALDRPRSGDGGGSRRGRRG